MKKYLKYLLNKNKRLFVVFTVLFTIMHSLFLLLDVSESVYINRFEKNIESVSSYSSLALIGLVLLIIIMPVMIQKKQMSVNGADLIYSIPMKREKRLFTEILYGWIVIFIPFIISCIFVLFIMSMTISVNLVMLAFYFLHCVIVTSAWYFFNVFIVNKCNSIRDSFIVEVLYIVIFLLIIALITNFFSFNSITIETAGAIIQKWNNIIEFVVPISALIAKNYLDNGWILSLAYLIYSIILLVLIKKSSQNKQAEKSGDLSESKLLYPLALNLIIIIILISSVSGRFNLGTKFQYYIFLFICYIVGNFVAQRRFKVKVKHILLFIVCITISYIFRYAYIQTACFNEAYSYREIKNVDKIYITYTLHGNYENQTYDLIGMEENLDIVMDVSVKIQDEFVKEYKESNGVPAQKFHDDGIIRFQYIHKDKKTIVQEYTYDISARDVQKIKRLFYKYDQTFDLKPL